MATEIELKLYCPPEEISRIESHPLVAVSNLLGPAKLLENTYFDTPDLTLHAKRISLRVRNTPTEQLQTVKCAAESVAGLSSRPEWETPYAGAFNFKPVTNRKVRAFLKERQPELVPVFSTSFERRTWRIDLSKKISVWVMVDIGHVVSGDRVLPISEVELELAKGSPEDLLDFAIALATHLPLVPNDVSKAERGYQLYLNHEASPQKAGQSSLSTKRTPAEAFHLLAGQGMQAWQANLLGTLTSKDQEFVHQLRVSLRRLNSLLKVFKSALPEGFQHRWTQRIKELSQLTGDVRDLDLMREGILLPMLKSDDKLVKAAVTTALAAWEEARQDAQSQVQQLSYGGPILLFARELQELSSDDFPKHLPRFAEKQLSGLHRSARKQLSKALKSPTPENAHRLRIALKHLRYSCEFFTPLFDGEAMLPYVKAITKLQDEFGFNNDFHVALSRLQAWVEQGTISKKAREEIAAWHTAHAQKNLSNSLLLAESVLSRALPGYAH